MLSLQTTKIMHTDSKQSLAQHFSQAVEAYDAKALMQKKAAASLTRHAFTNSPPLPPGDCLEIACGTGFLTQELLAFAGKRKCLITDLSEEMLKHCRRKMNLLYPNKKIDYAIADAENLSLAPSFSLIACNLGIQWFFDFQKSMSNIFGLLKQGGSLTFSYLSNQSFPQWKAACQKSSLPFTGNDLLSPSSLEATLKTISPHFTMKEETIDIPFEAPQHFFFQTKEIGTHFSFKQQSLSPKQWIRLWKNWEKLFPKPYICSYHLIYVTMRKS